ncbi:CPBP family glutamic-type intramembrane protease [Effusibacillus lacus]|uniref:CPBP family intramembrane metalloprotease domain-containing protein n=1 Tax=Effusibacillus lacus TaxID=1348429 RepID=A0A292YU52_9BACL|nr:type II CAAX endopeptidase family protein [Effusibacillus lacus]TCS73769.1 CAAX prenyl protease-like protein [Effusibacillus lacus]GAX92020.1 CPBP family intramembrane metalloprotease domain-containing protein [Effusibacillus lacus]
MRRSKHPVLWSLAWAGLFVFLLLNLPGLLVGGQTSLTREEASQRAAHFLSEQGISVTGKIETVLYTGDPDMEAYLKRHGLMESFERNLQRSRPLAYWEVSFFEPDGAFYAVSIDEVSGRVLGYQLKGTRKQEKPLLNEREALEVAQGELLRRNVDPGELELVTQVPEIPEKGEDGTRPFDYRYRWLNTVWDVGKSSYAYVVEITDNRVTGFRTEFAVPGEDLDWLEQQRSFGLLLTGISLLGMLLLVILSLVVAFVYPKREVDWQRGLMIGILLLGITLLTNLNEWPVFLANLSSYSDFSQELILWGTAFSVTGIAVLSSVSTYATTVAGAVLQRNLWPGKWLRWGDADWPERIRAAVFRGYLLAFVWLGVQGIFYWVSERYFGVWEESDFTMTPWNFLVPGLFPLLAWIAGIGEEITFRLLGIGLVKRYLRSTFLALLLPAMVWALGHSLYPVHPFYTRFIELTLLGMLIGWCFLRYDLETVIFAHVIFDTVLMCLPLLFGGTWSDQLLAIGWLILPATIGRYARWLQPGSIRLSGT